MQLAEIILLLSVSLAILAVCLILFRPKEPKLNHYEKRGLERFCKLIEDVGGIERAKIYTNGHPYVWVESTYEEAKNLVLLSCIGVRGMPKPASFLSKTNNENGHVYIVATNNPTFNWSSLQHYEEWLKNNKPVAERITKYKENQ